MTNLFFLPPDQGTQGLELSEPFLLLGDHIYSPLLSQIRRLFDHLNRLVQLLRNVMAGLYFLSKVVILVNENITRPILC